MAYTAIKSHLNVIEEAINLRFPIQRNSILYPALIVAERNVKNGKNNLNKKNKERMNTINVNNKNYLNKQSVRCKETNKGHQLSSKIIIITSIISKTGLLEEGKESIDITTVIAATLQITQIPPRPHSPRVLVRVKLTTTSKY